MSFFGGGAGERKTGTLFGSTAAPPAGSLFGGNQNAQNAPQNTGFGGAAPAGSLFGATQQPQQQQGQQGQQQQNGFFSILQPAPQLPQLQAQQLAQSQHGLPQLRQTADGQFSHSSMNGQREKSVVEQMQVLARRWDYSSPDCSFQHYFYNQVKPEEAMFYGPAPHEDERKWEEALNKKPSAGSIPVLARGFNDIGSRLEIQHMAVAQLQTRLHEINNSLMLMKSTHELQTASRISEARRKHVVFTQRTLALAAKTQILRNRGFAMDQNEEELKKKLVELEKATFSPVLGGRQEEIWARMSGVRERAKILQEETEKLGRVVDAQGGGEFLTEEEQRAVDKLLSDFDKQLEHLKTIINETKEGYEEWEKERQPIPRAGR